MEFYAGLGRLCLMSFTGIMTYAMFEMGREEYRTKYIVMYQLLTMTGLAALGYEVYNFFLWLFR